MLLAGELFLYRGTVWELKERHGLTYLLVGRAGDAQGHQAKLNVGQDGNVYVPLLTESETKRLTRVNTRA